MAKIERVRLSGRLVGEYHPASKIFVKKVRESVHLFRKTNSWGIDSKIIEALDSRGCKLIRVWDRENRTLYETKLHTWKDNAKYLKFDFGLQSFLKLDFFDAKVKK